MPRLLSLVLIVAAIPVLAQDDLTNTITVSGFGSVETPPDRATLVLSIVARAKAVPDAQREAADVTAQVLEIADDMNIPDSRVDTMSATVRPEYRRQAGTNRQELLGYVAQRQMRIEIHDLEKVGEVIERAVEAGVNQVTPPQLTSSRHRDAYRDALERAAQDARMNAERLAASLGLTLGDAIQVSTSTPYQPPMPFGRAPTMAMAAESTAPETYNAGDMTVTANVNVIFATTN